MDGSVGRVPRAGLFAGLAGADLAGGVIAHLAGGTIRVALPVGLLAGGLALAPLVRRGWAGPRSALRPLGLLLAGAAAIAVRGGLASSLSAAGWGDALLLPAAAVLTWGIVVAVRGLWVHPALDVQGVPAPALRGVLVSVVVLAVLVRVANLASIELLHEEAYYWLYAQVPALAYVDHPPMVGWLIALGTGVFGNTELGVRILAPLLWTLAAWFLFRLTTHAFDRTTAWLTVAAFSVLPLYFGLGLVMFPDTALVPCWAAAVFFAYRAFVDGERRAVWGVGVAVGLGLLTKFTIGLLGIAILVAILLDRRARPWLRRPSLWGAALVGLALLTPVLVWNVQHDWATFAHQSSQRLAAGFRFDLPRLFVFALAILTPVGLWAAIRVVQRTWRRRRAAGAGNDRDQRSRVFLALLTLVPLAVFVAASCVRKTQFNWTGPVWLPLLPLVANWALQRPVGRDGDRLFSLRPGVAATGWVVLFVVSVGLYHLAWGWPGLGYPRNLAGLGWRDVGAQLEALVEEREEQTGERPGILALGSDQLPSWVIFYRSMAAPDRSVEDVIAASPARHLLGEWSGMFEIWQPRAAVRRREYFLLDRDADDLEHADLLAHFAEVGPVRILTHEKNGRTTGTYAVRLVRGLDGGP